MLNCGVIVILYSHFMTKDINMNCGMTVILYSHFMTKDINDDAAEKLKFQVEFVCPAHYRIYKTYL